MAAAPSGFPFKHLIAVGAFIAIGLAPVEPAGAQTTRPQSACDIQSGARPDVGAVFGPRFTDSGYTFVISNLPTGTYDLGVYARSTVTGTFNGVPQDGTVLHPVRHQPSPARNSRLWPVSR